MGGEHVILIKIRRDEEMNQKKRTRAGTIALYVLAVLLICYGVYMMYSAYD